jgi:hypothetical protein
MSADKKDPGYENLNHAARIFLDGIEKTRVITADEELGYLLRYVTTDSGETVIAPCGKELVMETLYGRVVIQIDGAA